MIIDPLLLVLLLVFAIGATSVILTVINIRADYGSMMLLGVAIGTAAIVIPLCIMYTLGMLQPLAL